MKNFKRGDRVEVDILFEDLEKGITALQWGRVTLDTYQHSHEVMVVLDKSVRKLEIGYPFDRVRKLTLLECLADPQPDPPEEWYEKYDRERH